ncbi:MAG: methionyl aminopeptidase [Candidatus Deianiraeaceae bacterium]|jgi:methionyl aminopeptidase
MYEGHLKARSGIVIHKQEDWSYMRKAGTLAREVLDYIAPHAVEGVSTLTLNDLCHNFIVKNNAIPAPLNYGSPPFPKSICTSVNHVVCHGIPSAEKIIKSGDIMNIDVTVILDGYHGDTSRMYAVGKPTIQGARLIDATYDAMMAGIEAVSPGKTLRDIAIAIEGVVNKYGYSCVRDFCGHGIGKVFHMDPQVMHYNEKTMDYQDVALEEGMFFTVEPMVNVGTHRTIVSKIDKWTATTRDKKLSAQFEHTIGVTSCGFEIFTL